MEKIILLTDTDTDNLIASSIKLFVESKINYVNVEIDSITSSNNSIPRDGGGTMPATLILIANLRKSIDVANALNVGTATSKPHVIINIENLTTSLISRLDYKEQHSLLQYLVSCK